jgi:hypothetical protein
MRHRKRAVRVQPPTHRERTIRTAPPRASIAGPWGCLRALAKRASPRPNVLRVPMCCLLPGLGRRTIYLSRGSPPVAVIGLISQDLGESSIAVVEMGVGAMGLCCLAWIGEDFGCAGVASCLQLGSEPRARSQP